MSIMKSHSFLLLACALLLCACGKSPQRLLLGGSGWEKIVIIDKETKEIEWEHPLQKGWECNSVAATPDGNILFSYSRGAMLIDRNHEEIWNIAAPEGCEMQTARALPDGNYLLAWCGSPATVLEVSPKGEVLSKTTFDTGIEVPHMQFRQVNKNGRGNYMIPLFATSEVFKNIYSVEYSLWCTSMPMAMYNDMLDMYNMKHIPVAPDTSVVKVERFAKRDLPDTEECKVRIIKSGTILSGVVEGCIGCKSCVRECPERALTIRPEGASSFVAEIQSDRCAGTACRRCEQACPKKVLKTLDLKVTL